MNRNLKYQNELNRVLVKFVDVLLQIDPKMNEIGSIIQQKLSRRKDDIRFRYNVTFDQIGNIYQKLLGCYNNTSRASASINSCVQKLRNCSDSQLEIGLASMYPKHIEEYTAIIADHLEFIKKLIQTLNAWNIDENDIKSPKYIDDTDLQIYEYAKQLDDKSEYYIYITSLINETIDNDKF
jgi:hypothetical protein